MTRSRPRKANGASNTKSDQNGFDRGVLNQLRSFNRSEEPDFFESMILLLLAEFDKWQPTLSHAAEQEDWAQLIKAAHEMGGTGMQCGAVKLAELCQHVHALEPGDFTRARQLMPELLAEVQRVRRILIREVKR